MRGAQGVEPAPVASAQPGAAPPSPPAPTGETTQPTSAAPTTPRSGEAPPDAAAAWAALTIAEAHRRHPEVATVLARHHLPGCLSCPLSARETVAEGLALHAAPLDAALADLAALGPPGSGQRNKSGTIP
jgi:hypothetical protein